MKVLFVYPSFRRHAASNPELLDLVPMKEYLGSPSLGIAQVAACTPPDWEIEVRDDRLAPADGPTDADLVALSFFTPAASRAFVLAASFRARGIPVVAGGIFPSLMPDEVAAHVDAVVVGEGEAVWAELLADVRQGTLRKRYGPRPADLSTLPLPRLDLYFGLERGDFRPDDYPLQVSRGCALHCDACALPTSMGRTCRALPLAHILGQLDQLDRAGKLGCLTEDTSWFVGTSGHRILNQMLDALIADGRQAAVSYLGASMPAVRMAPASFVSRLRQAGVTMLYLVCGFDPLSQGAFTTGDPTLTRKAEEAVRRAQDAGLEPYTSFLIGRDGDDRRTVDRILGFCDRTNLRKAEFAVYTPYPGTPAWERMTAQDRILTRDWSRYNDAEVVFQPTGFTPDGLHQAYLDLWRSFYATRTALAALPDLERTIQF